jgi:hypothetical protein
MKPVPVKGYNLRFPFHLEGIHFFGSVAGKLLVNHRPRGCLLATVVREPGELPAEISWQKVFEQKF